jgi:hypothetical protein
MSEPVRVTLAHARRAALAGERVLCATGIRAWCARYDVDLRALAHGGLPVAQVEAIPDAFAQRVAALARAEAARG